MTIETVWPIYPELYSENMVRYGAMYSCNITRINTIVFVRTRAPRGMGQSHPIGPMGRNFFGKRPMGWDGTASLEDRPIPWDEKFFWWYPMGWDDEFLKGVPSHGIASKSFIPWDDFFRPIPSHAEPWVPTSHFWHFSNLNMSFNESSHESLASW